MKKLAIALSTTLLASCSSIDTRQPEIKPADLVMKNGAIYVADQASSVHQAIAIRDGEIIQVGSSDAIDALTGAGTRIIDLQGKMVMPGLHDMHLHALGTVEPDLCDLQTTAYSLAELVPVLNGCLEKYKPEPGEWLMVAQWAFSAGNQPSADYPNIRAALDAVSTETPIMLLGDDGHHSAVNSAALAQAADSDGNKVGLSKATIDSHFESYRELIAVGPDGEPTGGLSETARDLVNRGALSATIGGGQDPVGLMPRVSGMLAMTGITSFLDPFITRDVLASYKWLDDNGGLTFRVRMGLIEPPKESWKPESVAQIPAIVDRFKTMRAEWKDHPYAQVNGIKLFADAVLEGNPLSDPPVLPVAAVLNGFHEPRFSYDAEAHELKITGYKDQDKRPMGILEHHEDFIREYIRAVTDAGFHPHVHALSDRAVRVVADEFSKTKARADELGLNQSMAHLQLAHPDDVKRVGDLGISVAMTYAWAIPSLEYDYSVIPFIEKVTGPEDMYDPDSYFMQNVYPVRSLVESGANLTWGSDAPVESRDPRPWLNIYNAITRFNEGHTLNADQTIDIHTALRAFTINGAKMMGNQDIVGTLEKGKRADLIVIDRNIIELAASDPAAIAETSVVMTVFDGKVIYEAGKD